ncbi:nuclear transport factor 2-like isoform X4 [Primulina huaijiensis]|uniref:nuclear transport factor 2-like isoform X4 n=1 Tax=Primulina huaijiensis TaxID=1492673 RepID=UPI003CC76AE6
MASAFPLPVTAAQVGTYFVGQYYQMLQNQPDFVHQFYNDASTMLRINGNSRETASAMLQIHQLIMSLNYTGIEIKTAHSLESWNCGVLVMVSGSVHVKGFNARKKFVETFFLAPQRNLDSNLHLPATLRGQASNYGLNGDFQSREFLATRNIQDNGPANSHKYPEEQLQQVPASEQVLDDNFDVQLNGSIQGTMNSLPNHLSSPTEEPVVEPQKHTYASILQVAKAQSAPAVPIPPFSSKPVSPSDLRHLPEPRIQPLAASSNPLEGTSLESLEEAQVVEDEVEVMSVYVSNVPTTMAASEIGEEFKKFGKLKPNGVAIRTRKDIDACYAFVEFEDVSGVQNAIKASTVQIGAHQLYIEERRPNRNNFIRGGRARGRGRVSYYMEGTRGRFGGRSFGRGITQDGTERTYNRPRGNGFYRQVPRQEKAHSTYQQGLRNGHHSE